MHIMLHMPSTNNDMHGNKYAYVGFIAGNTKCNIVMNISDYDCKTRLLYCQSFLMQAGLVTKDNPKQLIIALEPEAASIYCRQLRLKECISDKSSSPTLTSRSPSTGAPKFRSSQGINCSRERLFIMQCKCKHSYY